MNLGITIGSNLNFPFLRIQVSSCSNRDTMAENNHSKWPSNCWDHFQEKAGQKAECKHCKKQLSFKNGTTRLKSQQQWRSQDLSTRRAQIEGKSIHDNSYTEAR